MSGAGALDRAAVVGVDVQGLLRARLTTLRADRWSSLSGEDGWDLDVLLDMVAPSRRPWLQRTVRAGGAAVARRLRGLPDRAAGWGAGEDRAWCAW